MFTELLVRLDGTVETAAALPAAKAVALAPGGRITLLRVPEDHRNPAEFLLDDDIAEDDLRVRAKDLADNGLKVDW